MGKERSDLLPPHMSLGDVLGIWKIYLMSFLKDVNRVYGERAAPEIMEDLRSEITELLVMLDNTEIPSDEKLGSAFAAFIAMLIKTGVSEGDQEEVSRQIDGFATARFAFSVLRKAYKKAKEKEEGESDDGE